MAFIAFAYGRQDWLTAWIEEQDYDQRCASLRHTQAFAAEVLVIYQLNASRKDSLRVDPVRTKARTGR